MIVINAFLKRLYFIIFFLFGIIIILISIFKLNESYARHESYDSQVKLASIVPFYWVIMLIGGIILIALSYVGWRKYKGEKSDHKRDVNN